MSANKIKKASELKVILHGLRKQGRRVVFTNGCYDILHAGHVGLLEDAKACGDILVLALNTDESVRRIKGSGRPINSESDRAAVAAALQAVDYVTFFSEDDPGDIIRLFEPDVLVKGGDWKEGRIVGSEFVLSRGGKVRSLPYKDGYSTSSLIEKVLKNAGK